MDISFLNKEQIKTYNALLESDKMTGNSESKNYLDRIKNQKNKNTKKMNEAIKNIDNSENEKFRPIYTSILVISSILLLGFSFYQYDNEFNSDLAIFGIILIWTITWFVSLTLILIRDFKRDTNKIFWIIAIIILPFTAPIFMDLSDKITIKD